MRRGLARILVLILIPVAVGCRIPGLSGPVSRSLATSRQLTQQGIDAGERGHWDRAETVLAEAVRVCPSNGDARRGYSEALWQRGRRDEAIKQLETVVREAPDDAAVRVRLSEMFLDLGDAPRAMEESQRAVLLDPKLAPAWAARARIQRAAGQRVEALADYHRALSRCPDDRSVQRELAETYRELNQPERSLAALHALADSYPPGEEPQSVLYAQGMALLALGRAEDAAESFSAACARDKPTPEILYRLAESQRRAGRSAEAVANAKEALKLDPAHRLSQHLLDRAHADMVLQTGAVMPQ